VEDERLIMESKQQLWQSIHQTCSKTAKTTDWAQELINDHREAEKRESVDSDLANVISVR
jgi:hypothetical protein